METWHLILQSLRILPKFAKITSPIIELKFFHNDLAIGFNELRLGKKWPNFFLWCWATKSELILIHQTLVISINIILELDNSGNAQVFFMMYP